MKVLEIGGSLLFLVLFALGQIGDWLRLESWTDAKDAVEFWVTGAWCFALVAICIVCPPIRNRLIQSV